MPVEINRADEVAQFLQKRANTLSRIDALLADLGAAVTEETKLRRKIVEQVGKVGGSWPDKFTRESIVADTPVNALVLAHLGTHGIGRDRRDDKTKPVAKLASLAEFHNRILESVQEKDLLNV